MKFGSLFSGIGGFDLGFERAGMQCAWQVEIDPYCNRVLAKHWPGVKRFGDIRQIEWSTVVPVDLLCGGFPCQPHSLAGKRASSSDERNLWPEFARAIRELKPRWIVAENVRGLLSSEAGRFFGGILGDLAGLGYDAEWQVISASMLGAPHERQRIYFVAYSNEVNGKKGVGAESDWSPKIFTERPEKRDDVWLQAPDSTNRVDDGIPAWFYEFSVGAYGNALVPQIAEWIGRRIIEASHD